MLEFKKSIAIGVSISQELGLEVAQIDYETRTVLKYARKPLAYDNINRTILDLDIFKETLQDLFFELQIPKGSEIYLNIPTILFKVSDYPASWDDAKISMQIEEDLSSHPIFKDTEPSISFITLPNSVMQFKKVASIVAQKILLIEIALQIKDLGYTVAKIDTSVNSTLNALIYNDRIDTSPDTNWVMLFIENNCCRILAMQGSNYTDCIEENISIGEVLGDEENYSIVTNAINPILKNLPSQLLYVISKTDAISAETLANKLNYKAPIIHQEENKYSSESFIEISPEVNPADANTISLDVIGIGIARDIEKNSTTNFNLYNESLGDVYVLEQPPTISLGSTTIALSITNMIIASIALAIIIVFLNILILIPTTQTLNHKQDQINQLNNNIKSIKKFLKDNKNFSTDMFDEGDELRIGLVHNKNIYTYYTIVGTEIPQKLWLTKLELGTHTTIEGQADNLESIYSFYRNIKDFNPSSDLKLQKLGLASYSKMKTLTEEEAFDTDSIISSMNADFYDFRISNAPEEKEQDSNKNKKQKNKKLELEPLE